jgi:hypothetical protein
MLLYRPFHLEKDIPKHYFKPKGRKGEAKEDEGKKNY